MRTDVDVTLFADQVRAELNGNLLPFWRDRAVNRDGGGFVAEIDFAGRVVDGANRGLILHARLLWTFCALHRHTDDLRDQQLAELAHACLRDQFHDSVHGGYHWEVDPKGQVVDRLKRVYGQAFCIYALSESHLAFGEEADREAAIGLFELIEKHASDATYGGYFEVCHADWSVAEAERLSDKDQADPKSMNNHLHVLEAYTNLYRIWPDARVNKAIRGLLDVFGRHILRADRSHQDHFFDRDWSPLSDSYTYGHDIESAWLLCEAAEVVGDPDLFKTVESWAVSLAQAVVEEGLAPDGALMYEGRDGRAVDRAAEWWPQAEAVVGLLHVHGLTGDSSFLEAASGVWMFIREKVVDQENGEWHWRINPDGQPDRTQPKLSAWKGPYHNVRMCLEGLKRLDLLQSNERKENA